MGLIGPLLIVIPAKVNIKDLPVLEIVHRAPNTHLAVFHIAPGPLAAAATIVHRCACVYVIRFPGNVFCQKHRTKINWKIIKETSNSNQINYIIQYAHTHIQTIKENAFFITLLSKSVAYP